MQTSGLPTRTPTPFANGGGKNPIPVASQISVTPGAASYTDGFPPLTRTPISAGGVPPFGLDFNGILNAITTAVRWSNAGGQYTYDTAFSTSVGGYPKGAMLARTGFDGFWVSSVENNTANPDTGGAGWNALSAQGWDYATGGGAANAYIATYSPAILALKDGLTLTSTAVAVNTGASTFSPNGLTAKPIVSLAQATLIGGELVVNGRFTVKYSANLDAWVLISATGGNAMAGRLINVQVFGAVGTFSYTPTAGTRSIVVEAQGGGASAGGVAAPATGQAAVSGGGSSGAYGKSYYQISALSVPVLVTVGAGGAAPTAGANAGISGGTTSFGSYLAAPGGGASVGCASQAAPIVSANGGSNPGPVGANIVGSPGQAGQNGVMISANSGYSGSGGSSVYGAGGNSRASANPGNPGAGYGGGGSGALQAAGGAALAGGAGTQGIVIIWEYA
ncbi:glycine-rich domain-containing protein [Pseudomonas sp. RIT-To-2]|uniref:glycine-rich domain-containing protein n=1 Tax=Pseudomonas sp. RIT-To-2 TaxID=3462541 RepID=UPI0024135B93